MQRSRSRIAKNEALYSGHEIRARLQYSWCILVGDLYFKHLGPILTLRYRPYPHSRCAVSPGVAPRFSSFSGEIKKSAEAMEKMDAPLFGY